MTAQRALDQLLRAHFERHADRSVLDHQLEAIADRTARIRQRPGWLAGLRSHAMSAIAAVDRPAIPRAALALVAVGLLILIALAVLGVGGSRQPPTPFNGLISFLRMDASSGGAVPFVIHPDGSHERLLRPEPHIATFWSPDGQRVGFADGYVNADGSGYVSLANPDAPLQLACFAWSPDGKRCLAEGSSDAAPDQRGLYLADADDHANPVRLTEGEDIAGAFSNDGSMVSFVREAGLWVVGVDGSGERRLGGLATVPDGSICRGRSTTPRSSR